MIPMNLWLFDVMCVDIYLCVHIWTILRTLETKSKISNLYSPRVLVMLLYMISDPDFPTQTPPKPSLRGMLVSWDPSGVHVISSTGWSHPFSWWFPSNPRVEMSGGWNENNTNTTSSAAQLVQVLNTSTVTWRVYFKKTSIQRRE